MYDEVKLKRDFLWYWHDKGIMLCTGEVERIFPELEGREVIYACFSSKKPRHSQFFTLKQPICDGVDGFMSSVREYRGGMLKLTRRLLSCKYSEGARYVWLEYEQDT